MMTVILMRGTCNESCTDVGTGAVCGDGFEVPS